MSAHNPHWLREILEDAAQKVKDKPDWMRSPELRAELRRIEERRKLRAEKPPSSSQGSQSST